MGLSLNPAKVVALCCAALVLAPVIGCGFLPPEASALAKVAMGQMDRLTGTEIQAVAATYAPDVVLTDEQADAVADFLATYPIKTLADVQALVEKIQTDPTSVELPDGFLELFEGFDTSTLPTTVPA